MNKKLQLIVSMQDKEYAISEKQQKQLLILVEHIADFPYALTPDQWSAEARQLLQMISLK